MSLIDTLPADPLAELKSWLDAAIAKGLKEPTAMTLATASKDGAPSARLVLCKGVEDGGVQFFTNYDSRKADELRTNPRAAVVFFWQEMQRQVRLEGRVTVLGREASEAYFATRARGSQIGAWASAQSRPLASYAELTAAFERVEREYANRSVPCPAHWGGFQLTPESCEFWEGKTSRLHDRVRYSRRTGGKGWDLTQLAP